MFFKKIKNFYEKIINYIEYKKTYSQLSFPFIYKFFFFLFYICFCFISFLFSVNFVIPEWFTVCHFIFLLQLKWKIYIIILFYSFFSTLPWLPILSLSEFSCKKLITQIFFFFVMFVVYHTFWVLILLLIPKIIFCRFF